MPFSRETNLQADQYHLSEVKYPKYVRLCTARVSAGYAAAQASHCDWNEPSLHAVGATMCESLREDRAAWDPTPYGAAHAVRPVRRSWLLRVRQSLAPRVMEVHSQHLRPAHLQRRHGMGNHQGAAARPMLCLVARLISAVPSAAADASHRTLS
jgi:hypothetical protein